MLIKPTDEQLRCRSLIREAEEILWHHLPSNTAILASLNSRQLKNETSISEMQQLLSLINIDSRQLNDLQIIHIAGSKGKGSTAAFVESILRQQGYKTALFTSPHLIHPRERLRLNGHSLTELKFASLTRSLYQRLVAAQVTPLPGLFRFITLLALEEMVQRRQKGEIDVAILEVGMGGRYDATNVVDQPIVTAITSLSMEHVKPLGPTLADIAHHKVGIAKPTIPLYSVPQLPEALEVIKRVSKEKNSPLTIVHPGFLRALGVDDSKLAMVGAHQRLNAALAVAICQEWLRKMTSKAPHSHHQLHPTIIEKALECTYWPGRYQIIQRGQNSWFLDGAHTIESIQYAITWFANECAKMTGSFKKILVFHVSHDRSFEVLLSPIIDAVRRGNFYFDYATFVRPCSPADKTNDCQDLTLHRDMATYWHKNTGIPAIAQLSRDAILGLDGPIKHCILVTGSLYLVGDFLQTLEVEIP